GPVSCSGCSLSIVVTLSEEGHGVHVHGPLRSDLDAIEHRRRTLAPEHELRPIAAGALRRERGRRPEHLRVAVRRGAQPRRELRGPPPDGRPPPAPGLTATAGARRGG